MTAAVLAEIAGPAAGLETRPMHARLTTNLGRLERNRERLAGFSPPRRARGDQHYHYGTTEPDEKTILTKAQKHAMRARRHYNYIMQGAQKKSPIMSSPSPPPHSLIPPSDPAAKPPPRWILVVDSHSSADQAFLSSAKKFALNLDYLIAYHRPDCGRQASGYVRLLGLCSRYLSDGAREFVHVCDPRSGEIIEDIAALPKDCRAVVAVEKGATFGGFQPQELRSLESFIEKSAGCRRVFGERKATGFVRSKSQVKRAGGMMRPGRSQYSPVRDTESSDEFVRAALQGLKTRYSLNKDLLYDLFTQFICLLTIDKAETSPSLSGQHQYCISALVVARFSPVLRNKSKPTQDRLLVSARLLCPCGRISVEGFVRLNSLFRDLSADSKLTRAEFWGRYFDPADVGSVKAGDFCKLVRGLDDQIGAPDHTEKNKNPFADRALKELRISGCADRDAVDVRKMCEGLAKGTVDERVFLERLGVDSLQ